MTPRLVSRRLSKSRDRPVEAIARQFETGLLIAFAIVWSQLGLPFRSSLVASRLLSAVRPDGHLSVSASSVRVDGSHAVDGRIVHVSSLTLDRTSSAARTAPLDRVRPSSVFR